MDALLQIGLYSREPSEKNKLPLLCWRTPASKCHVLRISKETPKKDKKSTTFIKGQMVKAQSIYLLHKGQRSGVTIPKHNRIFMDKSLNTEYHGMLQQFLNRDCPIPWESQLFYCNKESILGTCPYGSLPLSNPHGKLFCYRRSEQHFYLFILENVQLIQNPKWPQSSKYPSVQITEILHISIEFKSLSTSAMISGNVFLI